MDVGPARPSAADVVPIIVPNGVVAGVRAEPAVLDALIAETNRLAYQSARLQRRNVSRFGYDDRATEPLRRVLAEMSEPRRSLWARYVDWNVAAFDWCGRHARSICWPLAAVGYAGGIAVSVLDTEQPETGLVWVGLASALVALGMGPPPRAWAEDESLVELVTAGPWQQTEPPVPFAAVAECPKCGAVAVHPFAAADRIPETGSNPTSPLVWRECIDHACECVWSQLQ